MFPLVVIRGNGAVTELTSAFSIPRTTDLPGSKKRASSVKDNGIVDTAVKRSVITILTVNHLKTQQLSKH